MSNRLARFSAVIPSGLPKKRAGTASHRMTDDMSYIFNGQNVLINILSPKILDFKIGFSLEPCSYPAVNFIRQQSPHH